MQRPRTHQHSCAVPRARPVLTIQTLTVQTLTIQTLTVQTLTVQTLTVHTLAGAYWCPCSSCGCSRAVPPRPRSAASPARTPCLEHNMLAR